jgi:hypothetical protein
MPQLSIVIDQTAHTALFFLLPGAWSMTGPPNKQPGSSQPGRMGFPIGEKPGPAGVSEREQGSSLPGPLAGILRTIRSGGHPIGRTLARSWHQR